MKIIVDAFGGDNAPLEILKGSADAVRELDIDIMLTGREDEIRRVAKENGISLERMEIADAPSVISMQDSPGEIMRSKKDCSMAVSGALVVGSSLIVKRIRGVSRIAFAPVIPNSESCFMLIDCGANVDCKPEALQQFGIMGSIYMEKVMGFSNPRVSLANIGTEDGKGNELQREAFALLKESGVNFVGNVEARDVPNDAGEVVVADGFTGNVILKMYEGVAILLLGKLKKVFLKNLRNKIAAALVLKDLKQFKKQYDYNEYGGAPLVGCSKPIFKAHGSSKERTFFNAVRLTKAYVEGHVTEEISSALKQYREKKNLSMDDDEFGSED